MAEEVENVKGIGGGHLPAVHVHMWFSECRCDFGLENLDVGNNNEAVSDCPPSIC
jgi:hypothetical protein